MDMERIFDPDGTGAGFVVAGDLCGESKPAGPYCPHCGGALKGDKPFCGACGKRVSDAPLPAPKPEKQPAPTPTGGKSKTVHPAQEADHSGYFTSGGDLGGKRTPAVQPKPVGDSAKKQPEPIKPVLRTSGRSSASSSDYRIRKPDAGIHVVNPVVPKPHPTPKPVPKRTGGRGEVILQANIRTKKVKNNSGAGMKELIRDIRMDIREGTLVALLGTAGAGKSTVMNCLNGMDLQGVQGSVIYRGVDLMKDFEQMKYMIGSVPQKKIFHAAFTPEEEFTQAAMLRLPADTTDLEIRQRVNRTLEMLSMNGVRKTRNSKLSGGEQTRVNVGIELVADRDLLCLDEPDQGLSPNYKHELFEIMRNLAHTYGKTVLSIIHDVSEIDMFDQVIMLAKVDGVGRLAFSGTPAEGREFFGVDIRDAYALLERDPKRFVK